MRRAASRAACTAGNSNATSTPMMAITTSSSTSVEADLFMSQSLPNEKNKNDNYQPRRENLSRQIAVSSGRDVTILRFRAKLPHRLCVRLSECERKVNNIGLRIRKNCRDA